jgi:ABC-type Zn uptake system ZnuABC Zn-binding protein ZnuA
VKRILPWLTGWQRACIVLAPVLLAGCGDSASEPPESYLPKYRIQVAATTMHLAELARKIGGDAVTVTCLMDVPEKAAGKEPADVKATFAQEAEPESANPYRWQVKAADLFAMRTSQVVLVNGLGLENGIAEELKKLKDAGVIVVEVGEAVPGPERLTLRAAAGAGASPANTAAATDPAIWNCPRIWRYCVDAVVAALQQAAPKEAARYFDNRGQEMKHRLDQSAAWVRARMDRTDPGQRKIFVSHDSLGYFAREYACEVMALCNGDGSPKNLDPAVVKAWLAANRVDCYFPDKTVGIESIQEVAALYDVRPRDGVHLVGLGPKGSRGLGSVESFDLDTQDGALRHFVSSVDHHLPSRQSPEAAQPVEPAKDQPALPEGSPPVEKKD